MRRAARTDANHAEIRDYFRELGCVVFDACRMGSGFADLVVQFGGLTMLVEVKQQLGKLTKSQKDSPLMMRIVRDRRGAEETVKTLQTWADVLRQNLVAHQTREQAEESADKSGVWT